MKERPILFSGAMVRAILEGRKTQTRRVINPQPSLGDGGCWYPESPRHPAHRARHYANEAHLRKALAIDFCPYGQTGDRLWVRETWKLEQYGGTRRPEILYRADMDDESAARWAPWRPSIFMKRGSSRLTLEVTEVRVQRLQEISEEDARAEGVEPVVHEHWTAYDPATEGYPSFGVEPDAEMIARKRLENVRHHGPKILSTARQQFERLWQNINGERPGCSWQDNPWVWCVSFRRAE